MKHAQIWRALDALAARRNLTASGLARAAGLDPTTFNKSKRIGADGRLRWPSTESVGRALEAVGASFTDFAALMSGAPAGSGRSIPVVAMADADAAKLFDHDGFPLAAAGTIRLPILSEERIYALEISGDSMVPLYRPGDVVIVQPGAPIRRGDRIILRTRQGEILAAELGRRTEEVVEAISINPAYPPRAIAAEDIDWMARIVWSTQ